MMIDWVKKNMTTDLKCFHNYNSNDKKNTTKSHVNAKIKRYVCLLWNCNKIALVLYIFFEGVLSWLG